jgi:uncharacterized membrane protein
MVNERYATYEGHRRALIPLARYVRGMRASRGVELGTIRRSRVSASKGMRISVRSSSYLAQRNPCALNIRQIHLIPVELIGDCRRPATTSHRAIWAKTSPPQASTWRTDVRQRIPDRQRSSTGLRTPCVLIDREGSRMKRFAIIYLSTLVILLPVDLLFLGAVGKKLFAVNVSDMTLSTPRIAPAVLFYVIYLAGVVIFVNGTTPADWMHNFKFGALFGLFCYATFELTNMALLKHWSGLSWCQTSPGAWLSRR